MVRKQIQECMIQFMKNEYIRTKKINLENTSIRNF
mgnify:CR=1 FL=1